MDDEVKKRWAKALSREFEPEVNIHTPMGEYTTSISLAKKFDEFLAYDRNAYQGVMGGRYSYEFTATSMGLILVVRDSLHKREINLTNFENW